jgi:hypothetical protein
MAEVYDDGYDAYWCGKWHGQVSEVRGRIAVDLSHDGQSRGQLLLRSDPEHVQWD